jgi:TonB-linked SusC/RagA family outer membrane protein
VLRLLALLAGALVLGTATPAAAQTRIITGKVSDSLSHDPVTSGQVSVQGTTIGTTIKDDGTFTLAVPPRDVTLSIRSIGFKRADVTVPVAQSSVDVSMARDYFQLEAIVVTGQATGVERRNLANAVGTVEADKLVKAPAASLEQDLAGKMSGLTVAKNGYAPGGGVMVRLRGQTSIIGNASPLYVIDGVIASDVSIPPGTNAITLAAIDGSIATTQEFPVNRIADLNPNDIENIEVLKGASASAIYGSKASNGVILITTKRGRIGKPQFSINQRVGTATLYERHRSRLFTDSASAAQAFGTSVAALWKPGTFYDHDLELAGNHPFDYETSLAVNGGTEDTRYFASLLVDHEPGVLTRTYAEKQSLRLNLDQQVGSRFTFGAGAEVVRSAADRGLTGNDNDGTSYYYTFPYTPSFFDLRGTCGGTPVTSPTCSDGSTPVYPNNPAYSSNPLATAAMLSNAEIVWRSIMSGKADLDLIKTGQQNLKLSANGGVDFFNQHNDVYSPPQLQFEKDDGLLGTSVQSYSQNINSNINANVIYQLKPARGTFTSTTSGGLQYERRSLTTDRTLAQNLTGGLPVVSAGTAVNVQESRQLVRDFGVFAQEEFLTLKDKLLLTAGVRADQSSNNGDPKKLFIYPKGAISYRLTSLIPGFLDEVKLRGAIGQSGNQPLWEQKFILADPVNIAGVPSYRLKTQAGNPLIEPERQREIETGIDATLFKGRANLEFTVFDKKITNLLLSRALQPSQGFTSLIFSGAGMTTKGLETGLTVVPIQHSTFQWSLHGDFSFNRCTINNLGIGPDGSPIKPFATSGVFLEPGKPCRQATGRDTLASLADTMRIANVAARTLGTKVIGSSVNPMVLGDGTPRFQTNFSNDLTFKALHLYFLWFYQKGGFINDRTLVEYDLGFNTPDFGAPCTNANCLAVDPATGKAETLGAWRVRMNRTKTSRVYTQDDSFLKLREVALNWELPRSLVRSFWSGARFVRLGLAGRNLLTFSPCTCDEPEQGSVSTLYGATSNAWKYPSSRSFWFTVDLGF